MENLLEENKESIWEQYLKAKEKIAKDRKEWKTGETIWLDGEEYTILCQIMPEKKRIQVQILDQEKRVEISLSEEAVPKEQIDQKVIQQLKERTKERLVRRLPYWSEKMQLSYLSVRISDTKSKYGSCMPKKKALQFSARLAMLRPEEVDMVIVHELCHLVYANHSADFYALLEKYIPNYKEIQKELRRGERKIIF